MKTTRRLVIETHRLRIHPTAQRRLVVANVKRIVANLCLDAIGACHAVDYPIGGEKGPWIIDGQTRIHALLEVGLGDWPMDVDLHYEVKDDARSSALFLWLNSRSGVAAIDTFENQVNAREPGAVEVLRAIGAHGLALTRVTTDGGIACVSSLMRIHDLDGGRALSLTMDTAVSAWGRTASACEGRILEGLGLVFARYGGVIDLPSLVKKLAKYPGGPAALLGDAKGIREYRHTTMARCVAERIIDTYNTSRRERLDPL